MRFPGTFLPDPLDVPGEVVAYLARQLGIEDVSCLRAYAANCGRVPKTLHLLSMIDDEGYRRTMSSQINIHEERHRLARRIFHGGRGQLRQRYRQGREDQLGALGLVLNAVVLWNTRYMDTALAELRRAGHPVRDEDVARLSPLRYQHLNMLGRYPFAAPPAGQLRPLRDPSTPDDEEDDEEEDAERRGRRGSGQLAKR